MATGTRNTVVGYGSFLANIAGANNVVVGDGAAVLHTASNCTIVGSLAGIKVAASGNATLIGYRAGYTYNSAVTCVGADAGYRTSATAVTTLYNTFIGYSAGSSSITPTMDGVTAVGYNAAGNGYASESVMFGRNAGTGTVNGALNTSVAVGNFSAAAMIASDSVFIGYYAGNGQGAASRTVAVGGNALDAIANGTDIVAIGYNAMTSSNSGGTGNVAIGSNAGKLVNGAASLYNTLIGYNAGDAITNGGYNICIGYNSDVTSATTSYELNIGDIVKGSMTASDKQVQLVGGLRLERGAYGTTSNGGQETIIGCTAANITITLTSAMIARSGRVWIIKDESGGAAGGTPITVATEGAETIDGAASVTITSAYGVVRLYSNGTNLFTF